MPIAIRRPVALLTIPGVFGGSLDRAGAKGWKAESAQAMAARRCRGSRSSAAAPLRLRQPLRRPTWRAAQAGAEIRVLSCPVSVRGSSTHSPTVSVVIPPL